MRIILDIVLNYKESRFSKDNPKRDWYIWRDGMDSKAKKPSTNWRPIKGSTWEYDEITNPWYYQTPY